MDHMSIYHKIMIRALNRTLPKTFYTEKHHYFPKSIFGNNNALIKLTAKEHLLAHYLLWKFFKKTFGSSDIRTQKMLWSVWNMTNEFKIKNTRTYVIVREHFIQMLSKNKKGIPRTDKEKKKIYDSCGFRAKPIERVNITTGEVKKYDRLRDAVREGYNEGSIWRICNNKYGEKTHKGYIWRYSNIEDQPILISAKPFLKSINISTSEEKIYTSWKEIIKAGFRPDRIKKVLDLPTRTHKKHFWFLIKDDK